MFCERGLKNDMHSFSVITYDYDVYMTHWLCCVSISMWPYYKRNRGAMKADVILDESEEKSQRKMNIRCAYKTPKCF